MSTHLLEPPPELVELWAYEAVRPEVVPEVPDWLMEAPPSLDEPTCLCCGRPEHEEWDAWPTPVAAAGAAARAAAGVATGAVAEDNAFWATPGVTGLDAHPEVVLPSVGELVSQVVSLVEQLAAVDVTALEAGQALGEAQALTGVQHVLRAVMLSRASDVEERELFRHLGYRSASAWQRDTAPDTPRSEATLGRRLGTLPHLQQALGNRQVSFSAAQLVGKALADLRVHLDSPTGLIGDQPAEQVLAGVLSGALDLLSQHHGGLSSDPEQHPDQAALLARLDARLGAIALSPTSQADRLEQLLVLLAAKLPARELPVVLEHLRYQLLPDELERQERQAQHKRDLRLRPNPDGTWDLTATLTSEAGEQLFTALAAEARRDPANPLDTQARAAARDAADTAASEHASDDAGARAATEAAQAEGDADASAARAATEAARAEGRFDEVLSGLLLETDPWQARPLGVPEPAPQRPRSRGQRLHDAFGRLLTRYLTSGLGGTSNKVPVQITIVITDRTVVGAPGAPPARGGSGRPLPRSVVQRWWCDAKVTALVMSHGWTPLGVVHTQRTLTGIETTALRAQYGNRCPGIGCCTGRPDPLTPLVPHHIDLYSQTGATSLGLTLPVCEVLHQDIHLGKRTIRLRDGSYISEDGYLHLAD